MDKESIIELFEKIALPFKDKEGGPKLNSIQEILVEQNIDSTYIPGEGLIVNEVEKPRIILVSHMDLINKFRKGFADCKIYEILDKDSEEIIKGALDNTITNAVAILVLMELLKNNINDVELFLSEGEEVGMVGMENYLNARGDIAKNAFYINLDVTNEGWKQNISIEYDKPNFNVYKQRMNILKDLNAFSTGDRVCDDTDAVISAGCSGYSYCLPTKGTIHSYKNSAYTKTLEPYAKGLYRLLSLKRIKNFKISKNKNTILKIPSAFNSSSLLMDTINIHKLETNSISKMLESLYIEGFISYPRTEGISLEKDSYNKLYKKASELYNLNKMYFIGNYENAISPLNLEKRFNGDLNKVFNMIVRRSIASMLDNYVTTSLEYKLDFGNNKTKKIILLEDDKDIITKIYTPDYVLNSEEENKPYYIGNGVTEYEIIKLLSSYNIGKASTLPYIFEILKDKKFISKDYDDTFSILEIGNEILRILKKRLPFLDIQFYQYINKDFEYISKGMQNWTFPIFKLQNELKKSSIDIETIDFNFQENSEESEYKKLWINNNKSNSDGYKGLKI